MFITNTSSLPLAATLLAQAAQREHPPASLPALAALMLLAAVLVAAATAWVQRQRRRCQAASLATEQQEAECLLVPVQLLGAPGNHSSPSGTARGSAASGSSAVALEVPGSRRRARLEALLSAQLHRSDGSSPGSHTAAVDLLPLEALPTVLAHQLGSLRRAATPLEDGSRGSGQASSGAARDHATGGSMLRDTDKAAITSAWAAKALAASPPGSEPGSSPPRIRQWRMSTESMRLSAGELRVNGRVGGGAGLGLV